MSAGQKRTQLFRHGDQLIYLLIPILTLAFAGCAEYSKHVLPFTVIEEGIAFPIKEITLSKTSQLIVITELTDISQLEFANAIKPYLNEVDFNQTFVILVLRGQIQESGRFKDVIRDGNNVIIRTQDINPGPGNYVLSGFTPPYQIIAVKKLGTWGDNFNFLLERETSGLVNQQTEYVP